MNHTPDRSDRYEEDPYTREEREEPTHEEREEWIHERDSDALDAARDALHEKLVADELCNTVIPDLVLTRHQGD